MSDDQMDNELRTQSFYPINKGVLLLAMTEVGAFAIASHTRQRWWI